MNDNNKSKRPYWLNNSGLTTKFAIVVALPIIMPTNATNVIKSPERIGGLIKPFNTTRMPKMNRVYLPKNRYTLNKLHRPAIAGVIKRKPNENLRQIDYLFGINLLPTVSQHLTECN